MASSLIVGAALTVTGGGAWAQTAGAGAAASAQPQAQAEAPASVEEVVVTGSRLAGVTNLNSPSPITVASHEDVVLSKSTTVENVLNRLPAVDFNNGLSQASNNGGNGVSEVALRNLGPARTLILLDGQRLIPTTGGAVDTNIIPLAMIDRVEVLKGGASSIYGADAIGGVINLITNKHSDGMTFDANYGVSDHGDGQTYGLSSTVAVNTDRGNVKIGVGWDVRNAIAQSDRGWGTDLHANDPNYPGGSAWRSQLDLLQDENSSRVWVGQPFGTIANATTTSDPTLVSKAPNLGYVTALGKTKLDSGGEGWSTITSGLDRKQISLASHYDITDNITAVVDGFFTDYKANQRLRPEPLLGDTIATSAYAGFIIPTTNPYNQTGSDLTAYLTPAQFGPRVYNEESETYRLRAGLEGKFQDKYKWEFGYVYQRNTSSTTVGNEGNFYHLAQLTGQAPCVDVPGGCTNGLPTVPVNFFNGPNIFTPEQVAYATFNNTSSSESFERYFYADINGPIFKLPAGDVQAALGFETREEHYSNSPNELVAEGFGPNPQQPTGGGYDVKSLYGEFQVPVLKDVPFVKNLDVNGSARFDDYSNFGGQTTWKVGINYEVTQDLRFRAAYATAIRAPQVGELFGGTVISDNGAGGDPCETNPNKDPNIPKNTNFGKGVLTAGSTCSRAIAGGAAVTNFTDSLDLTPNNQVQVLQGGNENLQPEKARTTTVGAVITPRWVPGLTLAVDYYSIIITNYILTGGVAGTVGADFILNNCYGPNQNETYCADVIRNSAGQIFQINSLNDNAGAQKVEGFDYELSYSTRAAHLNLPVPGFFDFDLNVTNQTKSTQTNPDGSVTNFNGFFNTNNETNQPRWKGIFTADWSLGPWKFRYDARYTRHTSDLNGGPQVYGDYVPDLTYHDISLSYDLRNFMFSKEARIIIGVDNLADQDPPFIGTDSICKCNTIAGPFDVVGRYYYTRLSTKF